MPPGLKQKIIVLESRLNGLSNEIVKPPASLSQSVNRELTFYAGKIQIKLNGSCLKQDNNIFFSWESSKFVHCL